MNTDFSPVLQQHLPEIGKAARVESDKHWHKEIVTKLGSILEPEAIPQWFVNLTKCGTVMGLKECTECGNTHPLLYRCSLKYCPLCNWRISAKRKKLLNIWALQIKNPMHVVLTQKNFEFLTRKQIRAHTKCLTKIRRNKVFKNVLGGCVTVELTNGGDGWHLHSHWLVDANFIDMSALAIEWGKLVGQEYGIVHYNNSKEKSFVAEVTKYVVKGSECAKWTPEQLLQFVEAIDGKRFFFVFGNLFKRRSEIRALLTEVREPTECESCKNTEWEITAPKQKSHDFRRAHCLVSGSSVS